jgi:uncharacterized membrane protein
MSNKGENMESVKAIAMKHWSEFTDDPFSKTLGLAYGVLGFSLAVFLSSVVIWFSAWILSFAWSFLTGAF